MGKLQSSLLVLSALLCLTWGWEPGYQYVYKYTGRSAAGIYDLKQQNAVIELQSRVIVQSIDEHTVLVKLTNGQIKRDGNFLKNPYFTNEFETNWNSESWKRVAEIDGHEDQIPHPEWLGAPFVITHNKGAFVNIKIGAEEPMWIVNYKKSIASQLQLDFTGVRRDDPSANWYAPKEGESTSFTVFEDSIVGDCATNVAISQLPWSQVYDLTAAEYGSFDAYCKGTPVWQVVKTKDFNRCQTSPVWASAFPATHQCQWGTANCGDFFKRTSVFKFVACGESPYKWTVIHASGFSDFLVKPFATETEDLVNAVIINWELEKKESLGSRFAYPSSPKEWTSLSHVFDELKQWDQDETPALPNLSEPYLKSPFPVSNMEKNIVDALRTVARDLKEKPDSEQDNHERLAVVGRVLPMFSLQELKALWQEFKSQDYATMTLFVDCLVESGSNPAIMLIKELIETEQITGAKATWAMASIGAYAKTPTRELFHELVNLWKSGPVQASNTWKQTLLITISDLMNAACGSRFMASKRFPVNMMGDFCDRKDSVIINEFLPLLVRELETSQSSADRIVTLTAFGSFGFEEIVPILLPVIRGTPEQWDNTAERVRAILSLHRVVLAVPEKIHPILGALASNVGERAEVRMAALSILLMSNAPVAWWQKFAASTWFEPSHQVSTFTHSLIHSITEMPTTTPWTQELVKKASVAWPMVKPAPFGVPYSMADIRSTTLEEGISVMMPTPVFRVADEHWPVFLANRYFYQLGPFTADALGVYMWNYNMGDIWQSIFSKFYGRLQSKYEWMSPMKARESLTNLKSIWDELNATPRPADKRAGLLHINLMGSINRFFNLEKLEQWIPEWMAEAMKYQTTPYEVSVTKYRNLAQYNVRYPTELGLPMRFLAQLPILVSMQGNIKGDGKGGLRTDIAAEFSWKLSTELRVELPFNGNYIATGVDCRVDLRAPKDLTWSFPSFGQFQVTWTPGSKMTDLVYYHVKPYTVTRNWADSTKPIVEDGQNTHWISVTDKPIQRQWPWGEPLGLNLKWLETSELDFSDKFSWWQWWSKWDVNGWSNLGFVPLDLHYRQYALRYDPSGTRARSWSTFFHYQYATKTCQHTAVYQSGESQAKIPSQPEIVSTYPIATEFRPTVERVFKDLESGNAQLLRAGWTVEQKDGTWIHFNATMALSKDAWYTKDFTDVKIEKYTSTTPNVRSAPKNVDYAICYWAIRNWNKPAHYGFTKDVLYLTEEDHIAFGESCDHNKIRFKAKVYRDDYAAKAAMYSPAGRQCQKDMAAGWMYGSPACSEARYLDQTYNNYELSAETEGLSEPLAYWLSSWRQWINYKLYPFTVKKMEGQSNPANRATWIIKRDPWTGASNMTFVRPTETLVAQNVRWSDEYVPFSPLAYAYSKVFYPLNAGGNFLRQAANMTTGGVTEAKCYVGSDAVWTYDGAYYNYTLNECPHVLMTDCHKTSEIAVTAHQNRDGHKIVTVIYGRDTVELDASGYVTINGAKTSYKGLDKESRFEIREQGNKAIRAVVYPYGSEGVTFEIRQWNFWIKIQGSHIEMSAPYWLRGKTCGMCGDFNQEVAGEWKTAERCAVSAGELMAASFQLKTGKCSSVQNEMVHLLKKETETCKSTDQQWHTYLPDYDWKAPSKCTRWEKMTYEGVSYKGQCQSEEMFAVCQPGCKPYMMVSKPFNFKCQGDLKDFSAPMTVPSSCISY